VDPQVIHLTLKFLGQVPTAKVAEISSALERATQGVGRFSLSFGGLGCFPSATNPRVIWVGCQTLDDSLKRLHSKIEKQLEPLGFAPENRPFNPHLTLGRVRENASPGARHDLGGIISATSIGELGQVEVPEITLMQSILKPSGAEYTPLQHIPLPG
jgi:2'-5' RNA ligase